MVSEVFVEEGKVVVTDVSVDEGKLVVSDVSLPWGRVVVLDLLSNAAALSHAGSVTVRFTDLFTFAILIDGI